MADKNSRPSRGDLSWSRAGRAVVWLRFLIVPAWIVATVLAVQHLPSAFEAEADEIGGLLPHSSEAIEVERKAVETFGFPLLSRTMVVARQPQGFSSAQAGAAARYIAAADRRGSSHAVKAAVPITEAPGVLGRGSPGTTIVVYLYIDPALSEAESQESAERFAAGFGKATAAPVVKVTGALPATGSETEIAESHLNWVELATALVVVAILALYFGSLLVPLLGVSMVGVAYLCADRVLGWVAERYGLTIPREAEPVIVALIFGVLTDYLVFFVSGYRQRLRQGARSIDAVAATTAELLPVIVTAALTIAGATLTLLLSGVRFLSAFGPSMAAAVVLSALVAMTLVPAALAIFGRALLWPRGLGKQAPAEKEEERDATERAGARGLLLGVAVRVPVLTAVVCIAVLLVAASGLSHLRLGNPVMRGLPQSSEPRQGYDAAAASIGPGVLGPTMLVLEGPGIAGQASELASFQSQLEGEEGVVGALGPSDQPVPSRNGMMLAPNGNAARYVLVLEGDPDGATSIDTLSQVEEDLPAILQRSGLGGAQTGVTGDTTIASELTGETTTALERVLPAALAVLLLALWLLLRSWRAPLYLVGSSLFVVAAALGLTVYVFQDLLGYGEIAFFVPVASAILLLALGADYNVFLISRIWREADQQEELRPAIRTAGIRAGRAITVAGFILALSFAAIALIPIQGFLELAFALAVGLLLDTLLARTLLVPALVATFGRGHKQASAASERKSEPDFAER